MSAIIVVAPLPAYIAVPRISAPRAIRLRGGVWAVIDGASSEPAPGADNRHPADQLTAPAEPDGAFDWSRTQAGGSKIAEIRRARQVAETADPQTRLKNFGASLSRAPPATLALVAVFVLLTFFDVFFNISRTFICELPGGFCDPVING